MIVILATKRILSAEQCVLLQRYFILVLLVHAVLSSNMCSNQDVFKSSSRDFTVTTCIGKKKSDPKRRGVINKYMEVY